MIDEVKTSIFTFLLLLYLPSDCDCDYYCADTQHESGVDLAFDALMDLEENSDLSTFMKTFLEEGAETAVELWTSLDETTVATNSATQRVLRC